MPWHSEYLSRIWPVQLIATCVERGDEDRVFSVFEVRIAFVCRERRLALPAKLGFVEPKYLEK
jgi:hypothetical protein